MSNPAASNLASETCEPCTSSTPKLGSDEIVALAAQIPFWQIVDGQLHRAFKFPNFMDALTFANSVAPIAESLSHHPDILIGWGKAEFTIWTHAVNGLTRADFVLAAKIDSV